MMMLWQFFSSQSFTLNKTRSHAPVREFLSPPCCPAPGRIWRTLVFFSCIQKAPLVCEYAGECDCACSLDKGLSLTILTVTAFSALIYRIIFLAGSLLQPQAYPAAARMVVPKPEDSVFLLGFSPSMTPTDLRIRFTWNSRPSTIWPYLIYWSH